MNLDWIQQEENSLIYIGDTMCSWCYGFSKELDTFISNHPELKIRLVQGGLRPKNTEQIGEMKDFLRSHWEEIEERTGQPFAYEILNHSDFIYDTEPASRAVVVARMIQPEKELEFFKEVQTAFYAKNENTNQLSTYTEIATKLGIDAEKFAVLFDSEEAKYATKTDFQLSSEMGIKGFPSVVIKLGKEFFMISNGYREVKDLEEVYQSVLKSISDN